MAELKKILIDSKYKIPHSYNDKSNFRKYLITRLTNYKDDLKNWYASLPATLDSLKRQIYKTHIDKIEKITIDLQESINDYYNGYPDKSYERYKEILNELKTTGSLPKKNLNRSDSLFRIRSGKKDEIKERKNIFHVPFERRTKIAVQRYSIAGFPSLYLANSVYVAWEELDRPQLESIFFSKYELRYDNLFLDLSTDSFYKDIASITAEKDRDVRKLLDKALIWPILFICSIQVLYRNDSFKPEYIFPQFTLRWCREQNHFKGILYSSTRIHNKSKGTFYNVVLPVFFNCETNKDEPSYCSDLAGCFYLTLPKSIENIPPTTALTTSCNSDIQEIYSKELASNIKFEDSIFAKIETFLSAQTHDILES